MNCSRCNAEAVVKRGSAAYCAKCALARDWEDVIAIVQEERVDIDAIEEVELQGSVKVKKSEAEAARAEEADKAPAAVAVEGNGSAASDELPADPFA